MSFIKLVVLACSLISVNLFAVTVDLTKSEFKWKATKKVSEGHWGNVYLTSAKVDMKDNLVQSGEFVINMQTMTVDNLEGTWKDKFLTHIKSDDFFSADKYPTATLVLEKQTQPGSVPGKLTIKDKTVPVDVKYAKDGNTYNGTLVFDRTKWGVIYGSDSFVKSLTVDKIINNDVTLDFKVVAQ